MVFFSLFKAKRYYTTIASMERTPTPSPRSLAALPLRAIFFGQTYFYGNETLITLETAG